MIYIILNSQSQTKHLMFTVRRPLINTCNL